MCTVSKNSKSTSLQKVHTNNQTLQQNILILQWLVEAHLLLNSIYVWSTETHESNISQPIIRFRFVTLEATIIPLVKNVSKIHGRAVVQFHRLTWTKEWPMRHKLLKLYNNVFISFPIWATNNCDFRKMIWTTQQSATSLLPPMRIYWVWEPARLLAWACNTGFAGPKQLQCWKYLWRELEQKKRVGPPPPDLSPQLRRGAAKPTVVAIARRSNIYV